MAGDGARGSGRDLSADDVLSGASSAGWEELELATPGTEPARAEADPVAFGGERIVGDPFEGLDGPIEAPDLALEPVPTKPPAPPRGTKSVAERTEPEPPPLDPREVEAAADYGPAPGGIVSSVPYAVLVLTRWRAIRGSLFDLKRLEATAQKDHEDAMIALGRALHAARGEPAMSDLTAELARADEAGKLAGQRTDEWQRARETSDAQRASLTAKLEEAERAALPYRDRETKLATQVDVRETDLRRAKARLARVEIELRNLLATPAPDASRRELLEAESSARRADLEGAQAALDELAPKLAEARRELASKLSEVNALTAERRALDAAEARSEHIHLSTAGAAERDYHAAVAELATRALAGEAAARVAPDAAKIAARARAVLERRSHEVRVHEAALRAYDKRGFQRGAAILGAAACLVLSMLLFVILR